MKISTLLITTTHQDRIHLFENAIQSLEDAGINDISKEKILSIDILPDHQFKPFYYEKYEKLGWKIIIGECCGYRSMIHNIKRGLYHITGDYIFYCEDDIIVNKIPKEIRANLRYYYKNNKKIGFICYNTHIHEIYIKPGDKIKEDYINNLNN